MPHSPTSPSLTSIIAADAIGQLQQKQGLMAELASENGAVMLDWVDGPHVALTTPNALEQVESEARAILDRGIRHVIWAGMGGSVTAVRVRIDMLPNSGALTILPLDSTDPAALNQILHRLARVHSISPHQITDDPSTLRLLLHSTLMVGVAMGVTSEEPITHLEWFLDLLTRAKLPPKDHTLVMTISGSYLETFAHDHAIPTIPIQLDGGAATDGRMSAPSTRVFLLPAALVLQASDPPHPTLRPALTRACALHNLDGARRDPAAHPFVRLAAALADSAHNGVCLTSLALPTAWTPAFPWIEQLLEESLGKSGKGIVAFEPYLAESGTFAITVEAESASSNRAGYTLALPYLHTAEPLSAIAAFFMGWQLCMALYGWLNLIHFAGQPAVENYKSRARALRSLHDPLSATENSRPQYRNDTVTALLPPGSPPAPSPLSAVRTALHHTLNTRSAAYLDITYTGELSLSDTAELHSAARAIALSLGKLPCKLRRAPAAYHSTEQSEMDGPPGLLSLRFVAREHARPLVGAYSPTFLTAQAVGTWQATIEAGRFCALLIVEGDQHTAPSRAINALHTLTEGYHAP
jgi:hypothetical protein